MKRKNLFFAAACLLAGLVLGVSLSIKFDILPSLQSQNLKQEAVIPPGEVPGIENAVTNVANTAGKAVVSISTEHTEKIGGRRGYYFNYPFGESPFEGDEYFRKFFNEFFGQSPEREYKQMGLGSGVIIDRLGYILTNDHVIANADKITVTLSDGREFKGEIKGRDQRSDLAVIKINAPNLPVAFLGDSDNLKIGQWVVAIGNPFGFALQNPEPTVTTGVISALHRSLGRAVASDKNFDDLIQTDAAINPGNSGGPLVNLKGEIIGINVALFSTSGGYQGIGFAIPINNAKRVLSRLIEGKKIFYGWLGVTVQDLTDELARYFTLSSKEGALVARVLEGGPAQKAGMKDRDIITKFDDMPVRNVKELLSAVGKTETERKVLVEVIRDNKALTLTVKIGQRPENLESQEYARIDKNWRGIEVEDINSQNARRYNIEESKGVLIAGIDTGSPADVSGLVSGDVIIEINKQPVKNVADYEKIISTLKGNVLIKTVRGYFVVKEGE